MPVKTIPKVKETELMTVVPNEEVLKETERQDKPPLISSFPYLIL